MEVAGHLLDRIGSGVETVRFPRYGNESPASVATMRKALIAVLVGVAILASACTSNDIILNVPNFPIISASVGCGGAVHHPDGSTSIPMRVGRSAGEAIETVNLCFGTKGPYPFIVDTGAATTVFDSSLAKKLHLSWSGPSVGSQGAGCTASSRPASVTTWAVGGLTLTPQSVQVQSMPGFGGSGNPWGLLGSDVWSRFGALRFDFRRGTLTVPGTEAAPPTSDIEITPDSGRPTPLALIAAPPVMTAPMVVDSGPTYTEMLVNVDIGRLSGLPFAPDTGSSGSLIDTATAKRAHLTFSRYQEGGSTVCSTITTHFAVSGSWSLNGSALPGTLMSTVDLGPVSQAGFAGLLGSDVMSRFASVVFDYRGGRLLLGAG